jgi:hypothetical protein
MHGHYPWDTTPHQAYYARRKTMKGKQREELPSVEEPSKAALEKVKDLLCGVKSRSQEVER